MSGMPPEPRPQDEVIAAFPDVARELAAFTASLENVGYSRSEAMRLTGQWLLAQLRRTGSE